MLFPKRSLVFAISLSFSAIVCAVPVTGTFSGVVTSVEGSPGINVQVGSTVTGQILFDTEDIAEILTPELPDGFGAGSIYQFDIEKAERQEIKFIFDNDSLNPVLFPVQSTPNSNFTMSIGIFDNIADEDTPPEDAVRITANTDGNGYPDNTGVGATSQLLFRGPTTTLTGTKIPIPLSLNGTGGTFTGLIKREFNGPPFAINFNVTSLEWDSRNYITPKIEVTQSIQDINNSVPLIAEKATVARIYYSHDDTNSPPPTSELENVVIELHAKKNGVPLPDSPIILLRDNINPSTPLSEQRRNENSSINVKLYESWAADGSLELRLITKSEAPGLQSRKSLEVFFEPAVVYEIVPIIVIDPNFTYDVKNITDTINNVVSGFSLAERAYPVSHIKLNRLNIEPLVSNSKLSVISDEESFKEISKKVGIEICDHLAKELNIVYDKDNPCNASSNERFIAIYESEKLEEFKNCSFAVTNVGFTDFFKDINTNYVIKSVLHAGTIAHEIGHTHGLCHVGTEAHGGEPPLNPSYSYEYPHGGVDMEGEETFIGFDTELMQAIPPHEPYNNEAGNWQCFSSEHTHDLMSYGTNPIWISNTHYNRFYNFFGSKDFCDNSLLKDTTRIIKTNLNATQYEYISVGGAVDEVNNTVEFTAFYITPHEAPPSFDEGSGEYSVEFLDGNNNIILIQRFNIIKIQPSTYPPGIDSVNPGGYFLFHAPYDDRTKKIVLKRSGVSIGERNVSLNEPTITITYPKGGEAWQQFGKEIVTWISDDLDGDTLHHTVQYSADNGATWSTLSADITKNEFNMPLPFLKGSQGQAKIRVIVTDGVNTASATSNAFSVGDKNPIPIIQEPQDGMAYDARKNHFIRLEGMGFDVEDASIEESALAWSSSLDGAIGTGSVVDFRNPSLGTHQITLQAVDSDGNIGEATVTITVSDGPVASNKIFEDDFEGP